jgi:hypothetical protein
MKLFSSTNTRETNTVDIPRSCHEAACNCEICSGSGPLIIIYKGRRHGRMWCETSNTILGTTDEFCAPESSAWRGGPLSGCD